MVCCAVVGLILPGLDASRKLLAKTNATEYGLITLLVLFRGFIDNGTMLQTSQVKHPHTPIGSTAYEDINTISTKSNVKNFFVVRDQLGFGSQGWDIPYRTSGIDAGRDDQARRQIIPVQ